MREEQLRSLGVRNANEQAEQLLGGNQLRQALVLLDQLITSGLADFQTWRLAGNALLAAREFAQALDAFEHAVIAASKQGELALNAAEVIEVEFQRARCLYQLGATTDAVQAFRDLAETHDNYAAWCNLATIIPGCAQSDNQDVLQTRRGFAAKLSTACEYSVPAQRVEGRERLRIGYVSAFFHRQNYMKPVWSMLNAHDRSKLEIELFADDSQGEELQWFEAGQRDRVHLTGALSNEELVQLLRSRDLDVLVDLNGYSIPERLPVYSQPLARVGMAWFNMYATSALPAFDYIVGDSCVIPDAEDCYYTEKVLRLPVCYLTFDVSYEAPPIADLPCMRGQEFTFGSLVSQYKVTPEVIAAWSEILIRAPQSRLLLGNRGLASSSNRDYVVHEFSRRGVNSERLGFLPPAKHLDFLRYYDQFDVALDAFPYNGGTTTTEAIWQGVPVLAFQGDRWAARTSSTLLHHAGLGEFVAKDLREYIELGVRLANDSRSPLRLARIRSSMRETILESGICNAGRLAQALEDVFARVVAV